MVLLIGASMSKGQQFTADRLVEYFVKYLFKEYKGTAHVRRVAGWTGLVILGIRRATGMSWKISHSRQLLFGYQGHTFKVKYDHQLKSGKMRVGGIVIVEVLPARGKPEGKTVTALRNLDEAEKFYNEAPMLIQAFVNGRAKAAHA